MKDEGKSLELGAVSSVVEHYLDTVGVTGSNPVSRTTFSSALQRLVPFRQVGKMSRSYLQPPGKVFWAAAATSGSNQGRAGVARTMDFARYLQKRTADPSHTFRDHLRNLDGVIEEIDFS